MNDLNKRYEKSVDFVLKNLQDEVKNNQLEVTVKFETSKKSLTGCYIQKEGEHLILIGLPSIKAIAEDKDIYFYNLLFVPAHEYMHRIYRSSFAQTMDFKNTIFWLERALLVTKPEFYQVKHNDFYEEIVADYYGYSKADKFLKKNQNLIKRLRDYSNYHLLDTELRLINYDFEQLLNYFAKIASTLPLAKLQDNNLFTTFFDDKGHYRKLEEIINCPEFSLYDDDSKYSILASKSFLTSQDYSKLTKEELNLLLTSINYSYQNEINRSLMNENFKDKIEKMTYENREEAIKTNMEIYTNFIRIFTITLNKKQLRNIAKRKYLKQERSKLSFLLTTSKTFKKM